MYFIFLHVKETNSFSQHNVDGVAKTCRDKEKILEMKKAQLTVIKYNFFEKQYFLHYYVGTLLRKLTLKSIVEALTTFQESSRTSTRYFIVFDFYSFIMGRKHLLESGIFIGCG